MIPLIRGCGAWVAIPLKEGNECQESFGKPLQQVVTPTSRVACLRWRHEPTGRGPRFQCALIQVSPGRGSVWNFPQPHLRGVMSREPPDDDVGLTLWKIIILGLMLIGGCSLVVAGATWLTQP
jgi:hypothetical protein